MREMRTVMKEATKVIKPKSLIKVVGVEMIDIIEGQDQDQILWKKSKDTRNKEERKDMDC